MGVRGKMAALNLTDTHSLFPPLYREQRDRGLCAHKTKYKLYCQIHAPSPNPEPFIIHSLLPL